VILLCRFAGFFGLEYPPDAMADLLRPEPFRPPSETPEERRRWLGLMVAGWMTMLGPILASTALIGSTLLVIELGVIVLAAFPLVWRLHFSTFPRLWPNQIAFFSALILGIIQWRLGVFTGGVAVAGLALSYGTLVALFYWVMAFRAFSLRNLRDLTLTALPAYSGLLLILISAPTLAAVVGTALTMGGTLVLLAGEHMEERRRRVDEVIPRERVRGGRWRPTVNSRLSLILAAAVAATIIAAVATRIEPSNTAGRWLRRQLAWRLARLMIREGESPHFADWSLQLGGPAPKPRDRLMLVMKSEAPVKVRTAVYEIYDGRSWRQNERTWERIRAQDGTWRMPPMRELGLAPEVTSPLDVELTVGYGFLGVMPIPWCARTIRADVPSLRVDRSGMVAFNGHLVPGDTYSAEIALPSAVSAPPGSRPVSHVSMENALQLPASLPERVRRLARKIAQETGAEGPAPVAMAIEGHLRRTYEYDLQAPELPEGMDFVDHFLFISRAGYCNHYASAMAVMLRSLGIPARLVTGFTAGEYKPSRAVFEIRDQDAHAWVEVFLPTAGWIDFDPTPAQEADEGAVAQGMRKGLSGIGDALRAVGSWVGRHAIKVVAVVLTLLIITLAALLVARWSRRRIRPLRPGADARERILYAYAQALRWLAGRGLGRPASAAPWEFVQIAGRRAPALVEDLAVVTEHYVQARFAPATPGEGAAAATEDALRRLRELIFSSEGELDATRGTDA